VFDNASIIGVDPRIRAATPETIRLIFTTEYWYPANISGLYRPFTTLSYLWNYAVLGDGARRLTGYHWINLALHDVNILLVYALGCMILGGAAPAFALAALWAVHPVLTESVTNIVGRADLLAACGVLAGVLCHIRAISSAGRRRMGWLTALAAAQTVALFSKESGAILPAVMLLYDLIWNRSQAWRYRFLSYAVLLIPFGAFAYLRLQIDTHLVVHFGENALVGAGFWTQRITAIKVIGKFLWLFAWPARLSADYSFNAVPLFGWRPWIWEDGKALIALAACAGLALIAIRFRRIKPLLFFVGFFFIALAPSSNLLFVIGSIMAERFMYLPSLALCGCVVVAVQEMRLTRPWLKWAALGAVCLAFGMRTYARNLDWRDGVSLWSSAADAYPQSARAHFNLGAALIAERSDVAKGIAEIEAALRIRPDYPNALLVMGNALARLPGRMPDAIAQYRAALKLDPNFAQAHYNLGNALARTPGGIPEAIAEWQAAIRLQPDLAEAHYNLATADSQIPGRAPEAIAEYQAALRVRPEWAEAHNGLGNVLFRLGRLPEAIAQYQAAIQLRPDLGEPHYRLGMALLEMPGRGADAIAELEKAWRINPDPQGRRMIDELRARLR